MFSYNKNGSYYFEMRLWLQLRITNNVRLSARDLAELWEFGVRLYPRRVARLCHARG
jgi:hypothetical protein